MKPTFDVRSAPERQNIILDVVRRDGRAGVREIAGALAVTAETVRKDLDALQSQGLIRRVHGGALALESLSFEPGLQTRTSLQSEKTAIATAALSMLAAESVVLVEAGTTTYRMVELAPPDLRVTVVTNSLPIGMLLSSRPACTVVMIGGRLRPVTMGTVDALAVRALSDLSVDVAFLGTNAVSVERGLTTPDFAEAETKRAMLRSARRSVVLADHSKIGSVSLCKYGDLSDIDTLITDSGTAPDQISALEGAVERVVVATP
ncbi:MULTISPECIES: DeoR/GlpR family DNA-binding transcription regulator [unclassified Microbacterium]|uniref:DeoR/GlpR family DNA-binding transcription regulator n=1 Tax=unclassified Microbacterium TaxID=2609290 RepID=UPI00301994EA